MSQVADSPPEDRIFAGKRRLKRRIGMRRKIEDDSRIGGSTFAARPPVVVDAEIRGTKPRLTQQRGMKRADRQWLRQMSDSSHKTVHFGCFLLRIGVSPFHGIQAGHRTGSPGGSTAGPTVRSPLGSPGCSGESARFGSTARIAEPALCRHSYVTQRSVHDG
jgi:hypothetical protein